MRIWIINPYDNLPLEGYRPQRFWLMARAFARAGCMTMLWTSGFSHANKRQRVLPQGAVADGSGEWIAGDGFEVRLVRTTGYRANVGVRRIVDHWLLARRWRKMARAAERPDLIVVSSPPLGLVGAVRKFARKEGAPYIVDVMDAWPETFERVVPRFALKALGLFRTARANYLGAAGISAVADRYVDLVKGYGYQGPVRKFLHGIEMDGRGEREERGEDSTRLRLIYVGNMRLSYDLETLIRAVREMPDVTLDLAGDGPDRARLETLVGNRKEELGIREEEFAAFFGADKIYRAYVQWASGLTPGIR